MKNEQPRVPDFRGDGVAVWKNTTKDGKEYLHIKILGTIAINAWTWESKTNGAVKQ